MSHRGVPTRCSGRPFEGGPKRWVGQPRAALGRGSGWSDVTVSSGVLYTGFPTRTSGPHSLNRFSGSKTCMHSRKSAPTEGGPEHRVGKLRCDTPDGGVVRCNGLNGGIISDPMLCPNLNESILGYKHHSFPKIGPPKGGPEPPVGKLPCGTRHGGMVRRYHFAGVFVYPYFDQDF